VNCSGRFDKFLNLNNSEKPLESRQSPTTVSVKNATEWVTIGDRKRVVSSDKYQN